LDNFILSIILMDWTPYLESIRCDSRYALSRECFAPLDVLDHRPETRPETPFLLDLRVRTVPEATPEGKERPEQKVERWDVLEGLRRHAAEHVLLVGRPGSGKSTALQRLLLEEAERALSDADARIPVLLELRHYQESILDSLRQVLGEHGLFVDAQRLPEWLRQGRLLLLVDGINELPSDVARRGLAAFRREYRTTTPMIFATRELAVGGDLEIGKRLEMEPLTEPQMQRFVRAYLDTDGDKLLRQLQGRLRELAKVPLLLWMLCSLFRETQERLPENLGLALRQFTSLYDRQIKGNAPVSDESRRWWPRLLQRLAFKMLQGPEPTELHVAIARSQAEDWLTDYLREEQCDQPRSRAMAWLNDLVNHHLLQRSNEDLIEFRHQFIQEYYAAAYLLGRLSKLDDVDLQCDYLNYLKWTEPFILLLGLLENRKQALRVGSRMIDRFFLKEFRFDPVVLLELGNGRDMAEILLGDVLIIEVEIALQGGFQVTGGGEGGGFQHLGDAAVEAFDHAVGLRMPGLDQPVLDAVRGAGLIEGVLAGRFALAGGAEAVGELLAVVGQHRADHERGLGVQAFQEAGGGGGRFVGSDLEVNPAAGPVDGGDQIAVFGLVRHPGQVFHIDVHEARLVILEGLGQRGVAFCLRQQVGQPGHAVAAQTAIQRRARQRRTDELAGHHQQVVQRQQQQLAQLHHHELLHRRQRRGQPVRGVRAVLHRVPSPPAPDGGLAHPQFHRQFGRRAGRVLDVGPLLGRGGGVGVQANLHQGLRSARVRSCKNRRDSSRRRLRVST
jgi:hypothetical protein